MKDQCQRPQTLIVTLCVSFDDYNLRNQERLNFVNVNFFLATIQRKLRITLNENSVAYENDWNKGSWTMVYNQGYEVVVNFRTFFAFSKYFYNKVVHFALKHFYFLLVLYLKQNFFLFLQTDGTVISFCNETFVGKSHDVTLRHWACFYGRKQGSIETKTHSDPFHNYHLLMVKS